MSASLTATLDFIRDEIGNFGVAPTLREIAAARGLTVNGAHGQVEKLIAAGYLIKKPGMHRGLALPDDGPDLRAVSTERLRAELARRGETFDALATPRVLRHVGRPCAATRCTETVKAGQLFCRRHWHGLPDSLQRRVLSRYHAGDRDGYREAVRDAIDHADAFRGIFDDRSAKRAMERTL